MYVQKVLRFFASVVTQHFCDITQRESRSVKCDIAGIKNVTLKWCDVYPERSWFVTLNLSDSQTSMPPPPAPPHISGGTAPSRPRRARPPALIS